MKLSRRKILSLFGIGAISGCIHPLQTHQSNPRVSLSNDSCPKHTTWPVFQGSVRRDGQSKYDFAKEPTLNFTKVSDFPSGQTGFVAANREYAFICWTQSKDVHRYHRRTGAVDSIELDALNTVYPALSCSSLAVHTKSSLSIIDIDEWRKKKNVETASPYTGMLIDENTALVSMSGGVRAFSTEDGETLWIHSTERLLTGASIGNDSVYIIDSDSNAGKIKALDRRTGELLWENDQIGETYTDPVIGTKVYVTSRSGNLYALNRRRGTLNWKIKIGSTNSRFAVPGVKQGKVYLPTGKGGTIRALKSESGEEVWETSIPRSSQNQQLTTTLFAPVCTDNEVLVSGGPAGILALSRSDGSILWQKSRHPVVSPLAISDRAIFASSPYGVVEISYN